jgi:hypothetical protein
MGKHWANFTRGMSPAFALAGTAFLVAMFVGGPVAGLATYLDSIWLLLLADAIILGAVLVSVYGMIFRSWRP